MELNQTTLLVIGNCRLEDYDNFLSSRIRPDDNWLTVRNSQAVSNLLGYSQSSLSRDSDVPFQSENIITPLMDFNLFS
jgi:hypothetical protein